MTADPRRMVLPPHRRPRINRITRYQKATAVHHFAKTTQKTLPLLLISYLQPALRRCIIQSTLPSTAMAGATPLPALPVSTSHRPCSKRSRLDHRPYIGAGLTAHRSRTFPLMPAWFRRIKAFAAPEPTLASAKVSGMPRSKSCHQSTSLPVLALLILHQQQ